MKVYTRTIEGHRVLHYSYRAGPEMAFLYHLLSEVGAPWQGELGRMAASLAESQGCVIKQTGLSKSPWYVDVMVKP